MSKNRKIIELLELVYSEIDNYIGLAKQSRGLCYMIKNMEYDLLINNDEYFILYRYIKNNIPFGLNSWHYWFPANKTEPRKEWVKNKIQILKNKQYENKN